MKQKTTIAIERLENALNTYDEYKSNHAKSTQALTEAKKQVDLCARAVVDAENGAVSLFDKPEEEAPAEAKPRGRKRSASVGAGAP